MLVILFCQFPSSLSQAEPIADSQSPCSTYVADAGNKSDSNNAFIPIPELYRPDGDISLFFMAANEMEYMEKTLV